MSSPVRRRPRTAVAMALALAVAVAGCSDDAAPADRAGRTSTTAFPTTTVPAEVAPADVAAVPSEGCGRSAAVAGESTVTTASGGAERWYVLHVPPQHDGTTPVPLVVDLHGYSEGAQIHVAMSGLGPFGDAKGFVTVTPQGQGTVARWDVAVDSADLDFVGDLLDEVEATTCIDLARVYATGLSNGAFLASSIACRWADRVAAVAPVAGLQANDRCDASRPVPVIAFHGTADQFVSYDGGLGPAVASLPAPDGGGAVPTPEQVGPSVPDMAATWAIRNGCDPTPVETPVAADVVRIAFDCPPGDEVELYRVADGGHSWPGSPFSAQVEAAIGLTTMSVSANELIWDFFVAHPLPPS